MVKRGLVTGLAVLLALVLLGACAQPVSSSEAGSLSTVSSSLASSQAVSSRPVSSQSGSQPIYDTMSPTVPEGELVPVTDISDLQSDWLHEPGPVIDGPKGWPEDWSSGTWIYFMRFDGEWTGPIMLAFGKNNSDVGDFFRGDYTLTEDGALTFTLKQSGYEVPEDTPVISVKLKVEKSIDSPGLLVFTFLSIQTEDIVFNVEFGHLLNIPVAFVNGYLL